MPEMVTPTAAARAATRAVYCGRTAARIVAARDDNELARKGGAAAIEEMQRRQAVRK